MKHKTISSPLKGSKRLLWPTDLTIVFGTEKFEIYIAQRTPDSSEMKDLKNRLNAKVHNLTPVNSEPVQPYQRYGLITVGNLSDDHTQSTLRDTHFAELSDELAGEYVSALIQPTALDKKRLAAGEILRYLAKGKTPQMVDLFDYPEVEIFPDLSVKFHLHERIIQIGRKGTFGHLKGRTSKSAYAYWTMTAWDLANPTTWHVFRGTADAALYLNVLRNLTIADLKEIEAGNILRFEEKEILERAAPLEINPASLDVETIVAKMVKTKGKYRFFMIADAQAIFAIIQSALR